VQSNFDDVGDFHEKFGMDSVTYHGSGPRSLPADLIDFRLRCMREEITEFEDAAAEGNAAKMFDALIDLVYFALGTAQLSGFPWQAGWDAVQRANMAKRRARPDGADSTRQSGWDVVKPPGWAPPAIDKILTVSGFNAVMKCPQCQRDLTNVDLNEVHIQTPFPRVDLHCPCGRAIRSRAV